MKRNERGHQVEPIYAAIGGPLYAVHYNGYAYAAFSGANEALAYWRGLGARGRTYFHIENAAGETVTLEENAHGHAHSIVEKLKAADASRETDLTKES